MAAQVTCCFIMLLRFCKKRKHSWESCVRGLEQELPKEMHGQGPRLAGMMFGSSLGAFTPLLTAQKIPKHGSKQLWLSLTDRLLLGLC